MPPTANAIDLTSLAKVMSWLSSSATSPAPEQQMMQDCITAASAYWLWNLGLAPPGGVAPVASPLNNSLTYTETYDGSGSDRQFLRIRPVLSVSALSVYGVAIPASTGINTPGFLIDSSGKSISIRSGFGAPALGQRLTVGFANLYGSRGSGCWAFGSGKQNVQITYVAGFAPSTVANELWTIPATPYVVSVLVQPWFSDLGVTYFATGIPFAKVATAPAVGQYYIQANGQYLFNAADAGSQIQISYNATGVPFDIEMAIRQMVSTNYKRRQWIDQRSQMMANGAGSIQFRDWEIEPSVRSVMEHYRRRAIA